MSIANIKEEQKVYIWLPIKYEEGEHILSWALSYFPKDETKIVATSFVPNFFFNGKDQGGKCHPYDFHRLDILHHRGKEVKGLTSVPILYIYSLNQILHNMHILNSSKTANQQCLLHWPNSNIGSATSICTVFDLLVNIIPTLILATNYPGNYRLLNNTLDRHLAQCAIKKFKAEKLMYKYGDGVLAILELIDLRAIKNLVMEVSPTRKLLELVTEKANPTCKIWFIQKGNLLWTRYPKSDLTGSTSEKIDPALNMALHLSLETELQRREKLHQKEIEEIQKRENDKNDLLQREIEQLKLEKGELERHISDFEIDYNKLKQERDNAIKETQELIKQKEHSFANSDNVLSSHFSLSELKQATQNFSNSLKIGEGGFGCVYKGSLRKTMVAIKKLNSASLQGLSEFQQEVAILNRVRHPNIVNLIGSCSEISTLVYEFLPNGSLEDRLNCVNNTSSLTWQVRTRIISEICLGLVFLHSNKPHLVIHGDLKPDNILLDSNFISKLSDFGISKIIKQSDTNTTALYRTTHLAGTFSYIDPEYLSTGELTPKSDVYSFGIIVLRLLTGKPALNISNEVQEATQAGRLLSIVDKSAGKWPFDLAKKLTKLGMRCAHISRRRRPDMSQVWATIEPLVNAASLLYVGSSTFNEEHVPSHFICPIMQEIMKNPCIAADGFTYETEAMKTWLNGRHNTSPMTNLVLPHHDLIPNHVLRSAIQEWLQQHSESH